MTLPRNFPGRKATRRVGALIRLEKQAEQAQRILDEVSNPFKFDKPTLKINLKRMQKEIEVLEGRTKAGTGKRFTKKVGSNTGRRGF